MSGDLLKKYQFMCSHKDEKLLRILLDYVSLESESSKKLLSYSDSDLFEFVSLGSSTKHTPAQLLLDSQNGVNEIVIDKSRDQPRGYKEISGFFYKITDIQKISKNLNIEYDDLILVFILSALVRVNKRKTILVTERKKLLNRLNWRKNGFPKLLENSILSPDEAMLYIDLYCKNKNKFLVAPNSYVDRGGWYLYSLKTKLPNYQLAWSAVVFSDKDFPCKDDLMDIIESLGDRITDMLIAIDEIGKNYYAGVDNITQDAIIYHFNYWITLFTGVLDSLAWMSRYRYQITYENNMGIGLRQDNHKKFLKLVFAKNDNIKGFLSKNSSIVNLMYGPRDLVIHRTGLQGLQYDNRDENFYFNMVRILEGFFGQIVELSKEKGEKLGEWGHFKSRGNYCLEPYRFVKQATLMLISFVNDYLGLLNFEEYQQTNPDLKIKIEANDKSESYKRFLHDLNIFDNFRLGY